MGAIKWPAPLREEFHSLNSSPIGEWQVINAIYEPTILVRALINAKLRDQPSPAQQRWYT